jgi:hypothetical protein
LKGIESTKFKKTWLLVSSGLKRGLLMITGNGNISEPTSGNEMNLRGVASLGKSTLYLLSFICSTGMAIVNASWLSETFAISITVFSFSASFSILTILMLSSCIGFNLVYVVTLPYSFSLILFSFSTNERVKGIDLCKSAIPTSAVFFPSGSYS